MRGLRSLLVLLILAAGLGAYIYFVESERDPAGTETAEPVFADLEAADIAFLEIEPPESETVTLEQTDGTWRLTAPVSTPADQTAVGSVTSALASMDVTTVVEEQAPADLEPYGLATPGLTVRFRTDGGAERRLQLGDRTPTGSDVYVQIDGDPRLLLVASYQEDALNRTAFNLRDKSVVVVTRDDVDTVVINRPAGADVTVVRDAGNWALTEPVAAAAEASAVTGVINGVVQARMATIAAEGEAVDQADMAEWGLDSPQLQVTLGAGSTRATLAIGGESETGALYARDLSRPIVFTVPATLLTDVDKQPEDLRLKDVFAFKTFSALEVDITWDSETRSFVKRVAEDDNVAESWRQTAPEARDVNQTAMTDLLNSLSSLRAESFVASPPANGDDMVVEARSGAANAPVEDSVTLRRSGETVYALVEGSPDAAVVSTTDFDRAVTQIEDLAANAQ